MVQTYWPMGRVLPLWSKPPGPQILLSIISVPTLPLSPTNRLFFISCLEPSSYGKVPPLWGDVWGEGCRDGFPQGPRTTMAALTWPGSGRCRCQQTWGQSGQSAHSRCGQHCPGATPDSAWTSLSPSTGFAAEAVALHSA